MGFKTAPSTAEAFGVSVASVRAWESNRRPIRQSTLKMLENMEKAKGQKPKPLTFPRNPSKNAVKI